jgi:hypothetical protein
MLKCGCWLPSGSLHPRAELRRVGGAMQCECVMAMMARGSASPLPRALGSSRALEVQALEFKAGKYLEEEPDGFSRL